MLRTTLGAIGAALLLALITAPLAAQVPDPIMCFPVTDLPRIGCSPKNQNVPLPYKYEFVYALRDLNDMPVVGFPASLVALDFVHCSHPNTRPTNWVEPDGPSDGQGYVTWSDNLTFGGGDPCQVELKIYNMTYYITPAHSPGGVRSVDGDGDGFISLYDLVLWQMAFVAAGNPPYQGDLYQPFDDQSALADLVNWQYHFVAP